MGILDELEGQATRAAGGQASAGKMRQDIIFYKALEKRTPIYKTLAILGALIPFFGWSVTMFTYILVFTVTKGGDTEKALREAVFVGFGYGVLTFLITWGAFALGYHSLSNDTLLVFYGIAALLVYFTFAGCKRVSRLVQVSEEASNYISSQS